MLHKDEAMFNSALLRFECEGECQATFTPVLYSYRASVPCNGVPDNRQPEAGASYLARASFVDSIKTLKQVRQMLGCDSATVVGHDY